MSVRMFKIVFMCWWSNCNDTAMRYVYWTRVETLKML